MLSSLLITLREGLEAALVVGIILAYLAKTGNRRSFRPVWWGTALGILGSLLVGGAIFFLVGELHDPAEAIFEGSTLLVAVGVMTWMIFWMRKQARDIRTNLQAEIDATLTSGSHFGLALLAFVAVVREGIETVLFLFAATRVAGSNVLFTIGGLTGLAVAVAIGYTIYKGSSRLNLRAFFNWTSLFLIILAAGLLARGIHEFTDVGLIPPVIGHIWDTNGLIPAQSTLGQFMTGLFGYDASPSLTEAIVYFAYLGLALGSYFRPFRVGEGAN